MTLNRFYKLFYISLLLPACLFLFSCHYGVKSDEAILKSVPLPLLTESPIKLSVIYAINPRLPKMTPKQINALLSEAENVTKRHFNVDIDFEFKGEISLEELTGSTLSPQLLSISKEMIYDFKGKEGNRDRLIKNMEEELRKKKTSLHKMIDYARPYLIKGPEKNSYAGFSAALVDTMLTRLDEWKSIKGSDGKPVIDDSFYNEYIIWDMLGYGQVPYDIVLTNQLIASAEYLGQDIHSAIRGGITAGATSYNRDSPFGSYVFFTTFLYSNHYELLLKLRNNGSYGEMTAATLAGAYLAHEIGHLLFHFGHPYGSNECVMNPVELLKFHEWYGNIDAEACQVGSNESMKAGSISITYDPRW